MAKNLFEEKLVDLFLMGKKSKCHYVLIKDFNIFIYDYTLHRGKNVFVVFAYKPLVQKNYQNVMLKVTLKLMVNKWLRCPRRVNMLGSKVMKEK